jgi:hypothetical protein
LFFSCRELGIDETENHHLVVGHVPQGCEGAGALIVIFEKKSLRLDGAEKLLRNGLIVTFRQPPAVLVASSKVKPERDVRKIAYHGVLELDASSDPVL